jgi:hypothetical protein
MGPINSSTSANLSCTNPLCRVIEALASAMFHPLYATLMGG